MPGTRKLGKTTAQRKAMLRQQVTEWRPPTPVPRKLPLWLKK